MEGGGREGEGGGEGGGRVRGRGREYIEKEGRG